MARLVKCERTNSSQILGILKQDDPSKIYNHLIVFLFVSKHRMSSIMTVCLNIFLVLACQDVINWDGCFPVFTYFSQKGYIQDPGYFLRKTIQVIPWHNTKGFLSLYHKNVLHALYKFHTIIFLSAWVVSTVYWWSNWIKESYQAIKQLFIVLTWLTFDMVNPYLILVM